MSARKSADTLKSTTWKRSRQAQRGSTAQPRAAVELLGDEKFPETETHARRCRNSAYRTALGPKQQATGSGFFKIDRHVAQSELVTKIQSKPRNRLE